MTNPLTDPEFVSRFDYLMVKDPFADFGRVQIFSMPGDGMGLNRLVPEPPWWEDAFYLLWKKSLSEAIQDAVGIALKDLFVRTRIPIE